MAFARLSSLALLLVACAALAQATMRVRGMIEYIEDGALLVQGLKIRVTDKTEILSVRPIKLADIRPGDFLGVASRPDGGRLIAYEIRRFPKPLNPGHRPLEGRDDHTMTNATVSATVQSASGRELTLTYEGGAQKVSVHPEAFVAELVPGHRRQLVPDAWVNLTMDASGTALRVQVSAQKPPR